VFCPASLCSLRSPAPTRRPSVGGIIFYWGVRFSCSGKAFLILFSFVPLRLLFAVTTRFRLILILEMLKFSTFYFLMLIHFLNPIVSISIFQFPALSFVLTT
jgi:hypothetical protein